MGKQIEVIGIDHGWSGMKTVSQVFTTGVKVEIKDEIQREMISILASSLLAGKAAQMPETKTVMEVPEEREETADETMMGLASSWG